MKGSKIDLFSRAWTSMSFHARSM